MKIATITCHDVYNYGASLQAYALQKYCTSQGCLYTIIDYKPDYLSRHFNLWGIANPVYDRPLLRQLYLLAKLPQRIIALKKKKRFDEFTRRFLSLSDLRYQSCTELENNCPDADLYIAGSDQIWNTFFPNGHDRAFYLDFVKRKANKISYAASFATDKIYNDADSFVAKQIQNFDAVSVRETSALYLLRKLGRNDGTVVADPVFLLDHDQWTSILPPSKPRRRKYILLYDCEKSPLMREMALHLKKITGLPVYSVAGTYGRYADSDFSLSGPLEFLKLISEAEYVLANSFHALAFSLIFRKKFFIANRSENINTRMVDFLSCLKLSDRLISEPDFISTDEVDFVSVSEILSGLVERSRTFLNQHIHEPSQE